ncbi:MAG: 4-alpha-glucanotransferase [Eubacterium sp.]|nr:4-alpha-glucanotransferase [Eubacterium sp.]
MAQKEFKRSAGILMPISSLPSPYGIGTFGSKAYKFVDHLEASGQKFWQVLPLGPTSFGDSPYQSFSAFAGNPYFIDLDFLIEDGLITRDFVEDFKWSLEDGYVDYGLLFENRYQVLREAFANSDHQKTEEYKIFVKENDWLEDYALYRACKTHFEHLSWEEWPKDIKTRKKEALAKYKKKLKKDIDFYKFLQFKFFEQWYALKEYANDKGIEIIGDIPVYVAMDSAEVWKSPKQFKLNKDLKAEEVAGVPPDIFSEFGQKWGNPLYDWAKMEKDGFKWWKNRMSFMAKMYDVIRIDHFLGLVKYYSIPAEDGNAVNGKYLKGPGMKLIKAINEAVGDKKIIAEDLGVDMPEAKKIIAKAGYPSMKVLEFAFDGDRKNPHLPYNYNQNMVVYGGTHDNDTLVGYFSDLQWWQLDYVREYMGDSHMSVEQIVDNIFREAYKSVANLVVFQLQDVLKIDSKGRMNVPSTLGTNWRWRMKDGEFTPEHMRYLRYMTDIYGRL